MDCSYVNFRYNIHPTPPLRYDKRTKPAATPLHVNVSVMVLSLSSPDESSLNYDVEFLMHQEWTDPRQEGAGAKNSYRDDINVGYIMKYSSP
jgi:hypothetical protein